MINPGYATSTKETYNQGQTITGNINYGENITTIRLYLTWDDSESNIMDNTEDTQAAADEESKAIIKTTLKFSQVNQ